MLRENISCMKGEELVLYENEPLTLKDVLIEAAKNAPDKGIIYSTSEGKEDFQSYPELFQCAKRTLSLLRDNGIKQGDFVILEINNKKEFFTVFWACIIGGIIPAPISEPNAFTIESGGVDKIYNVWNTLNQPCIITTSKNKEKYNKLTELFGKDAKFLSLSENIISDKQEFDIEMADISENDIAFLQFSSGSTGLPKGVILKNNNIFTCLKAMAMSLGLYDENVVGQSWLPHTHDMGLVGSHLLLVLVKRNQIHFEPTSFFRKPLVFLKKIQEHKTTITVMPDFGFNWLLEKISDKDIEKLDLSSIDTIANGAEPISADIVARFINKFKKAKLNEKSLICLYGLAEATLGVSFPKKGSGLKIIKVNKLDFLKNRRVTIVEDGSDYFEMVCLGEPIHGMNVKILNENGDIVPPGYIGKINISGGSVTEGYINNNNPEVTQLFSDNWLDTGDMGCIINGELIVTGREKDIIFVRGQNFYANDIEHTIGKLNIFRKGEVAAVGVTDPVTGTEQIIIFVAYKKVNDEFIQVIDKIKAILAKELKLQDITIINVKNLPKTTSGKIQRSKLREEYLNNKYDEKLEEIKNFQSKSKVVERVIVEPTNFIEEKIRDIWSEILMIDKTIIGIEDDFFELGGNSVKAVQQLEKLEKLLNAKFEHDLLIECRTIKSISQSYKNYLVQKQSFKEFFNNKPLHGNETDTTNDISVIGMELRFPDADNKEEFWDNLLLGKSSDAIIPEIRKKLANNLNWSDSLNCINNIDCFDNEFFKISEEETRFIDPQQRILLETVYHSLEDAAMTNLCGKGANIGVYVGANYNGYQEIVNEFMRGTGDLEDIHQNTMIDNSLNILAARISHTFNFTGPAMAIDTACSSSLAALNIAVNDLRCGKIDYAIVGATNLVTTHNISNLAKRAGIISKGKKCKVFDDSADGTVLGEGIASIILQRNDNAIKENRRIYGVIKGIGINNDGQTIGIMSPNPNGQSKAIAEAHRDAHIMPSEINYIEAHGIGTYIGDEVTLNALKRVYSEFCTENEKILLGSVKNNIGHLLAASGMAGIIKVLLCLKNRVIVPSVNIETPNTKFDFANSPFKLARQITEHNSSKPLNAAISSFGFGGTNVHVILQEAGHTIKHSEEGLNTINKEKLNHCVLNLSAKDEVTLQEMAKGYAQYMRNIPDVRFEDLCYSAINGKESFEHRTSIIASSKEEAIKRLDNYSRKIYCEGIYSNRITKKYRPKIAFMFTGQGSQYLEMAKKLFDCSSIFKETFMRCDEIYQKYSGTSIRSIIYDANNVQLVNETIYTQPALFIVEYSLARLIESWGIEPTYLIGHSLGEYVAACIAGVWSLEDAIKIITKRGEMIQELPNDGGMVTIFDTFENVQKEVAKNRETLSVAAINGPELVVVSGKKDKIEEISKYFEARNIKTKQLNVSHAFHSPLLEPIKEKFMSLMSEITFNKPQIKIISNVSGKNESDEYTKPDYWLKHLLSPVQFFQGMLELSNQDADLIIEIGPHPVLTGMSRRYMDTSKLKFIETLNKKKDDSEQLASILANLFVNDVALGWNSMEIFENCLNINTPKYPFKPNHHWLMLDSIRENKMIPITNNKSPLLGEKLNLPTIDDVIYQNNINLKSFTFLRDHVVYDNFIVPSALFIVMLIEAAQDITNSQYVELEEIAILQPMILYENKNQKVQLTIKQTSTDYDISIVSFDDKEEVDKKAFITHCVAKIKAPYSNNIYKDKINVELFKKQCKKEVLVAGVYDTFDKVNLNFGSTFRWLESIMQGDTKAIAKLAYPENIFDGLKNIRIHPGLIDAGFQLLLAALGNEVSGCFVPVFINKLTVFSTEKLVELWSYTEIMTPSDSEALGNIQIFDSAGNRKFMLQDVEVKQIREKDLLSFIKQDMSVKEEENTLFELENMSSSDKFTTILELIQHTVAGSIGVNYNDVNPTQSLIKLGVDSLSAIELRAQLKKRLEIDMPITVFMEDSNINDLATKILEKYESERALLECSVTKADDVEYNQWLPLSYNQQSMYFLNQMDPESSSYNISFTIRFKSQIDHSVLKKSFQYIIDRHDILKMTFSVIEGRICQKINHDQQIYFKIVDCEGLDDQEIFNKVTATYQNPFNLEKGPLFKVHLFKKSNDDSILLITVHHIINDFWSFSVLIKEFETVFKALSNNEEPELPKIEYSYKDYIIEQRDFIDGKEGEKLYAYWKEKLLGKLNTLELPFDRSNAQTKKSIGKSIYFSVPDQLVEKIKNLADKEGITNNLVFEGIFALMLNKLTGQDKVAFLTPTYGRNSEKYTSTIGYFVNPVIISVDFEMNRTIIEMLHEFRNILFGALENQEYPFSKLTERINRLNAVEENIVFQADYTYQNLKYLGDIAAIYTGEDSDKKISWCGCEVESFQIPQQEGQFNLSIEIQESNVGFTGIFKYNANMFNRDTIQRMIDYYINLLSITMEDSTRYIHNISLVSGKEKEKFVSGWNSRKMEYPEDKCFHEIFSEVASEKKEQISVVYGDDKLSYSELDKRSNKLARFLRKCGVKPNDIVGIMMDRSVDMIISVLGVLKAGGAYLPIDPKYPADRISYMIENSEAKILLTESKYINYISLPVEIIDVRSSEIEIQENYAIDNVNSSSDLVYIIYTSGTTGKPKGVMIRHFNYINSAYCWKSEYNLDEMQVNLLQMASFSFDVFSGDLARTLLTGGKLIICPEDIKLNFIELYKLINDNKITLFESTPGLIIPFMEYISSHSLNLEYLKLLILGSDTCKIDDFKKLHDLYHNKHRIINSYGVTEATIDSSYFEIGEEDEDIINSINNTPIGKALPNMQFYILDKHMNIQPVGIIGELYIGGKGVAKGYMNNTQLTKERFIKNPFDNETVLYKTGDLAKWLPDGNVEFIGRRDNQVKIRGYRIELQEIEKIIKNYENITDCVVDAKKLSGSNIALAAYIIVKDSFVKEELDKYLKEKLPDYMIPNYYVEIDQIPLSTNGKVDRRLLPMPEISTNSEFEEPNNDTEKQILEIWSNVFASSDGNYNHKISINDNFFEIGGHSLLAVDLASRLQEKFTVDINMIFQYPTIKQLAKKLDYKTEDLKSKIQVAKENSEKYHLDEEYIIAGNYAYEYDQYIEDIEKDISKLQLGRSGFSYENVLLTGSTGYLGVYLLHDLLINTNSNVVLLVRGTNIDECEKRIKEKFQFYFGENIYELNSNRISIFNGDISRKKFGLQKAEYDDLCSKIDCIINSAAIVSHYGRYEDFYGVNVAGVENCIELQKNIRKKDLFHISTTSVGSGFIEGTESVIFSEMNLDVGQNISNVYVKTKYEAEKLIENAKNQGLNITVFRVGNLVFNSKSGAFQENISTNAFYQMIKSLLILGVMPDINIKLDFSYIDFVSNSIITIMTDKELMNSTYHIQNPKTLRMRDLFLYLKELNFNIELLSYNDFLDYVYNNYNTKVNQQHIDHFLLHSGFLDDAQYTNFILLSERTDKILNKLGLYWERPNIYHIEKMIRYGKEVEFFPDKG